jgi:hypothetical protein
MEYFRAQPAAVFSSLGLSTKVCARSRARARVACSLRRSAKREKTKVRWPGSLSCRSIAAARAALSSSTTTTPSLPLPLPLPSSSPFFRSPCCASLRGDVIYSAEFTRVCKQADGKRRAMREEKEERSDRERVNGEEEPLIRAGFRPALYLIYAPARRAVLLMTMEIGLMLDIKRRG